MFKIRINRKNMTIVFSTVIFFFASLLTFNSCDPAEDNIEPIVRYINVVEDETIIPTKIAFGRDKQIIFKIKIDENYVEHDLGDSLVMDTELFLNDSTIIPITFFDDGGINPASFDFVAQNKLWTGTINSLDFPIKGDYLFRDSINLLDSYGNLTTLLTITEIITVKENREPVIESVIGVSSGDSLLSGFDNIELEIDVTDEDNDVNSSNDSQLLYFSLLDSMDVVLKTDTISRSNILDNFEISLDSTYAVGIKSSSLYKFKFRAEDEYEAFSNIELFDNIRIENEKPVVDSVNVSHFENIYDFEASISDKQGGLSFQDIENVEFKLTVSGSSWWTMLDNGIIEETGDRVLNDGIYTIRVAFPDTTHVGEEYFFEIRSLDKAGNQSNILENSFIYEGNE